MVEIFVSILANAISYSLGLGTKWVLIRFKTRGQRRFWAPFLKGRGALSIVLTDKDGQSPRSPRKISLTDVHAYSDVRSVLASLGREVEIKTRSQAHISELSKDCFVSLGGPLANGISEQVLCRLGSSLPVTFNPHLKCFEFSGTHFCSSYDSNQLVERDYGLIIRLRRLDPSNVNSKPALVVFGLHGHGTQQAVHAIIANDKLGSQLKPHIHGNMYALLEFRFKDHNCIGSSVVSVDTIR